MDSCQFDFLWVCMELMEGRGGGGIYCCVLGVVVCMMHVKVTLPFEVGGYSVLFVSSCSTCAELSSHKGMEGSQG
jgi:hypothetical protein